MAALWENVTNAITQIKDFVLGFAEIANKIVGFIPSPFKEILIVAIIIVVALVAAKIVRG